MYSYGPCNYNSIILEYAVAYIQDIVLYVLWNCLQTSSVATMTYCNNRKVYLEQLGLGSCWKVIYYSLSYLILYLKDVITKIMVIINFKAVPFPSIASEMSPL